MIMISGGCTDLLYLKIYIKSHTLHIYISLSLGLIRGVETDRKEQRFKLQVVNFGLQALSKRG